MKRKRTKPPRQAPVTPGKTSLSEMIAQAQAGDTFVAREIVELLRDLHSEGRPVPEAAKAYLTGIYDNALAGKDAFNLKSKGRPREWPHDAKVLAVSVMNQFIEQGRSIDDAAAEGSNAVNQIVRGLAERLKRDPIDPRDQVSPWAVFIRKRRLDTDSLEPLKSWYLELLKSKKPE